MASSRRSRRNEKEQRSGAGGGEGDGEGEADDHEVKVLEAPDLIAKLRQAGEPIEVAVDDVNLVSELWQVRPYHLVYDFIDHVDPRCLSM